MTFHGAIYLVYFYICKIFLGFFFLLCGEMLPSALRPPTSPLHKSVGFTQTNSTPNDVPATSVPIPMNFMQNLWDFHHPPAMQTFDCYVYHK